MGGFLVHLGVCLVHFGVFFMYLLGGFLGAKRRVFWYKVGGVLVGTT